MEATNRKNHGGKWNFQLEDVREKASLKRNKIIEDFERENRKQLY